MITTKVEIDLLPDVVLLLRREYAACGGINEVGGLRTLNANKM